MSLPVGPGTVPQARPETAEGESDVRSALFDKRLRLPVIGSPMFIGSGPELVIAQCKAGVVGSFPALNARPQSMLRDWILRIKEALAAHDAAYPEQPSAPFAVNQICHGSNARLAADMEVCVEQQVPIIITSLRPPAEIVRAAHSYGGLVFHDVINVKHARKAAEQGVDGLILVCAGAGGHGGTLSPFALVSEVRQWFDGTIILSGTIANGWSIAGAIAMGADFAYMGTRLIAPREANADERYRQMLVDSAAEDIVYSSLFTGIHGNYLRRSIAESGFDPDRLPTADKSTMNFGSGGNMDKKVWKDILGAGHGVGSIAAAQRHETARRAMLRGRSSALGAWRGAGPRRRRRFGVRAPLLQAGIPHPL